MNFQLEVAPLWSPEDVAWTSESKMAALMKAMGFQTYSDLWQWSIDHPDEFWSQVWDLGVIGEKGSIVLADAEKMPGAKWFPDASLNYAENLLNAEGPTVSLKFWGENKVRRELTRQDLRVQVARIQHFLKAKGVGLGDRVVGYLPNLPETIIAMLATTAMGAVWSSASPDFGVQGVIDRFGQIEPKVLFCTDGYWYNGKRQDCMAKNVEVVSRLPTVIATVVVSYLSYESDPPQLDDIAAGVTWHQALASTASSEPEFARVAFDHPLFIMFSSGTTGVPKCIVHSHGGTLLQHIKEHQFHCDLRQGDRLFYFTTCGWMMWNWLVSGLASGVMILLYDGSPFIHGRDGRPGSILFDYAEESSMTHFGTSAKFIDAIAKAGLSPSQSHNLTSLRVMTSTGSPLAPESFDFVYREIKNDVLLASISGGTDIVSCFALGNPQVSVYRGEIQSRGLGMAVDVFDDNGQSTRCKKGELVCTRPFPSMPIGFWNDPDGSRYHAAYFDRFPNIWCHGDFAEITTHEGLIIYGRSDTTLNPGGVRIGTAEIYRQVEQLPEVLESLVIGQDWPPERCDDVRIILFVRLADGIHLDDALIGRIKRQIRDNTTPRHVPSKVVQVADIPRTKSGKIVELAVRNIVHGQPVKNIEALANPEALTLFSGRPELSS